MGSRKPILRKFISRIKHFMLEEEKLYLIMGNRLCMGETAQGA